jgi:hypothetical protein
VAEASLKEAIIAAMKGTTNPARLDQVTKLEREFRAFTKIFAEIVKLKEESALIAKNQLARSGTAMRFKLDDLPSNADDSQLEAVKFGARRVADQFQMVTGLVGTFVINADQTVAASAVARMKFVENTMKVIPNTEEKINDAMKEVTALFEEYGQALTKLIANSKEIEELTVEMTESATAINNGSSAMKSDLLADQKRLEAESRTPSARPSS